jgi:hypothetical protein
MPIASSGGGYQFGDGNVNEVDLTPQAAAVAYTSTAVTLTTADLTVGLIQSTNASAVALTLPTAALTDAAVVNARADVAFDFSVINTGSSSGAVTMTAGTGWTIVGSATVAISTSARFRARKTGDAAWVLYRTA